MKSSINSRKDNRTKEEFAKDIKTYTSIEGFVAKKWAKEMVAEGHTIELRDTGVDNKGEVVEFVGFNFDYEIIIDELPMGVDIKHNHNSATATFKRHNLDSYVKNNVSMLLLLGTGLNGRLIKEREYNVEWNKTKGSRKWAFILPHEIENIIENVPCTKVKWMGNKPGHIIYERQFKDYFTLTKFKHV